jgi:hypothetical protein
LYICGIDYLMVKGYVIASIADHVFGFVGDIPIINTQCGKYFMYYGVLKILMRPEFYIGGWRRGEAADMDIVYSCIDDVMEFYEAEEFIYRKVPVSIYGFGSWEMYRLLTSLARGKNLYILRYFC